MKRTRGIDPIQQDPFTGAILGLALGDAIGAPFEGGILERSLWRLVGRTRSGQMRWTDDTQMSLDLAESLIANGALDLDDVARRFARSYRWSRGYGPGAAKLLKRIRRGTPWQDAACSVYPEGSFGNGGAMRAPIVGLFFATDPTRVIEAARATAAITHAHPLGIEGAVLIATAVSTAATTSDPEAVLASVTAQATHQDFRQRLELAAEWLANSATPSPREVAKQLGNAMTAPESCITAVYLALRFHQAPFLALQSFVAACGGDTDTIGAMSGAIWGATNGASSLPSPQLQDLEQLTRLQQAATALHAAADSRT